MLSEDLELRNQSIPEELYNQIQIGDAVQVEYLEKTKSILGMTWKNQELI